MLQRLWTGREPDLGKFKRIKEPKQLLFVGGVAFWDCHTLASCLHHSHSTFSPCQFIICRPQIHDLSSLLLIHTRVRTHMHTHTHTCWVHVYLCLGLTSWHSQAQRILVPPFLASIACSSSSRLRPVRLPSSTGMSLVLALCESCLGNHIVDISSAQLPFTCGAHYPTADILILWLTIFHSVPWALDVWSYVADLSIRNADPLRSCFGPFNQ